MRVYKHTTVTELLKVLTFIHTEIKDNTDGNLE